MGPRALMKADILYALAENIHVDSAFGQYCTMEKSAKTNIAQRLSKGCALEKRPSSMSFPLLKLRPFRDCLRGAPSSQSLARYTTLHFGGLGWQSGHEIYKPLMLLCGSYEITSRHLILVVNRELLIHSLTVSRLTPRAEGFGSRPRPRDHRITRAYSFSIRPTSMPHRGQVRCIACRPAVHNVKKEEAAGEWIRVHGGHARIPAMASHCLRQSEGEEEGSCRYETRTRQLCKIVSHGWSLPATKRRSQTPC